MGTCLSWGKRRVQACWHVLHVHLSGYVQDGDIAQAQGHAAPCSRANGAPWNQAGTVNMATLAAQVGRPDRQMHGESLGISVG